MICQVMRFIVHAHTDLIFKQADLIRQTCAAVFVDVCPGRKCLARQKIKEKVMTGKGLSFLFVCFTLAVIHL